MRRLLDLWDTHMQRGTPVSIAVGVVATLVLLASVFSHATDRYIAFFFAFLGMAFTWREYVVWRRTRDQGGVELIGTRRELEERGL